MSFELIEKTFIESHGNIKPVDTLTDTIPKGVTIFYGRSGAGKTYSLIKHLAKNNIKPLLLDFDNNHKLDFDYHHVNGFWFFKNARRFSSRTKAEDEILEFMDRIDKTVKFPFQPTENCFTNDGVFESRCLSYLDDEKKAEFRKLYEDLHYEEHDNIYKDQTVIIDTYGSVVSHIGDEKKIQKFIKDLKKAGANVIIVSHETGERGKDTGIEENFANHCDGRLKLNRDISKTKKDTYLIVEKKRGHQGDSIIWDWERES